MSVAPATAQPRRRSAALDRLPAWAPAASAIIAIAGVTWAIFSRAFLNYDTLYALIWGRDLVHGRVPDYDTSLAPTPHPLATAVGAFASLFGEHGGYVLMLALALISFGALLWGIFKLGTLSLSWPVGLLAAIVVGTRAPVLSQAVRAYVDIPFLALVVLAAVLEASRPRRGWPVLAVLAVAGLLRPEAWLLAAAYWLYLAPRLDTRERIWTACLVAAAPLVWALSDLAVTGNALHSLTATRDTAETLGRPRGIGEVPETMPRRLGEILRLPALVGGTAGFFLALYTARERAAVPLALALLGGAAFVLLGFAGLPLIGRYLFLPAMMLAIFFGFSALGWREQAPGVLRRRWAIGGLGLLIAFGAFAPANIRGLDDLRDGVQLRGMMADDLRSLTVAPAASPLLARCDPIYVPNHRPVPILAYYLDRRPDEIVSAQLERPRRGLFVAPATRLVEQKFVLDPRDPRRLEARVPRSFRRVTGNRSWTLYQRQC